VSGECVVGVDCLFRVGGRMAGVDEQVRSVCAAQ